MLPVAVVGMGCVPVPGLGAPEIEREKHVRPGAGRPAAVASQGPVLLRSRRLAGGARRVSNPETVRRGGHREKATVSRFWKGWAYCYC